jgi:hypothetical protein
VWTRVASFFTRKDEPMPLIHLFFGLFNQDLGHPMPESVLNLYTTIERNPWHGSGDYRRWRWW